MPTHKFYGMAGGRVLGLYPLLLDKMEISLYLLEDEKLPHLMRGCLNRRLRRMNHLGKWKKAGGV